MMVNAQSLFQSYEYSHTIEPCVEGILYEVQQNNRKNGLSDAVQPGASATAVAGNETAHQIQQIMVTIKWLISCGAG